MNLSWQLLHLLPWVTLSVRAQGLLLQRPASAAHNLLSKAGRTCRPEWLSFPEMTILTVSGGQGLKRI